MQYSLSAATHYQNRKYLGSGQLNFNLTWQIINNFNLGISLLDSYDSRPPTVESDKNDMSLALSVGYSY